MMPGAAGSPDHGNAARIRFQRGYAAGPGRVSAAGEAIANGELAHPDGERSRVVFMAWHHESHHALGSYTLSSAPGR